MEVLLFGRMEFASARGAEHKHLTVSLWSWSLGSVSMRLVGWQRCIPMRGKQ